MKAKAVGIDLGTTYSCVGIWQDLQKRVEIITNEQGNRTTPSMVAFTPIESLVGQSAMNQVASNSSNTVFDAKRIIGKKFSDPSIQTDKTVWPFTVVSGADGKPLIQVSFKNQTSTFTAEEISSMVLSRMKMMAENFLGEKVTKAVITVPAHFNNSQRQGTKDAGLLAGLEVMKLLNEPTAAAIAYGIDRISKEKENILVYDLGGGTFDVAVLSVEGKKSKEIQVKAVGGDTHLGGQDFDNRLVQHFALEFKRKHDKDISTNPKSLRRLRNACERAKRELSWSMQAIVDVPCIFEGEDLSFTLTRAKFEQLNMDLFQKTISLVKSCLADSNMAAHEVSRVVLIGGSSRIPKVEQLLQELFQTSRKFHKQINPDEAVAYGAAIQAAILNGDSHGSHVSVRDVVPLSLGIGTRGDIMNIIIPRNTPIPTQREKNFVTSEDFQTSMDVEVYEGERAKASDNLLLGKFTIEGIPAALKGEESVTVSMHVDENGILTVTAYHKSKAIIQPLVIDDPFARFVAGETEEMISTAQKHRLQDKAWKEVAVLRNELRDEIYNATEMLQAKRTSGRLAPEYQDLEDLRGKYQTWVNENSHPTKTEVQKKIDNIKQSMKRCNEMRRKSSSIISSFGRWIGSR